MKDNTKFWLLFGSRDALTNKIKELEKRSLTTTDRYERRISNASLEVFYRDLFETNKEMARLLKKNRPSRSFWKKLFQK